MRALERNFTTKGPNEVWVTDITYIRTWQGWLHRAVVMDLCSRKTVGWSMADNMRMELVPNAFESAVDLRPPGPSFPHHSDQGSQYTSWTYQPALWTAGVRCSMSRRGNCYDNAVVESVPGSLKREPIHRHSWPTREEARMAVHDYVGTFYNPARRHSTLENLSPDEFERRSYVGERAAA